MTTAKKKIQTIELQGKEYAQVKSRIKAFREDCPRGSIKTSFIKEDTGEVTFTAYVLKDKADETSADATGHAMSNKKGDKDFEKLETIAVGRALAMLGFGADGEIASSEEMKEFEEYQKEKQEKIIQEWREKLQEVKSEAQLKEVWSAMPVEAKKALEELKEELKQKHASKKVSKRGGVATSEAG